MINHRLHVYDSISAAVTVNKGRLLNQKSRYDWFISWLQNSFQRFVCHSVSLSLALDLSRSLSLNSFSLYGVENPTFPRPAGEGNKRSGGGEEIRSHPT